MTFSRLPFVFGQALSLHTKHTDYISFKLPHLSSCANRLPDFFSTAAELIIAPAIQAALPVG
jgi:hypothetical protein